jgi:hypothetical protein
MTIVAVPATPGPWVDCSQKLTLANAVALKAHGIVGVFRYVPLPGLLLGHDLDAPELLMLTRDAGLQVSIVQHPRFKGWDPLEHDGYRDGQVAVEYAQQADAPEGIHIACDFEGPKPGTSDVAAKAFIEGHARACLEGGYLGRLYCGFDDPLSPNELYWLRGVTSYWSDEGHRVVSVRGVDTSQGAQFTIAGVTVDPDDVHVDRKGDVFFCAAWVEG